MNELLKLLGQELYDQVIAKLGGKEVLVHDKGKKFVEDNGNLIPKDRLDEVIQQKKDLKTQLDKADQDLKDLKKAVKGNEELEAKITALQDENKKVKEDSAKAELKATKSLAVKEALMNSGVVDAEARDLLLTKFNLDTLELDETGKVRKFDELLKPIKESGSLSKLFGQTVIKGQKPTEGDPPFEGFMTKEQVNALTETQLMDDKTYNLVQKSMAVWPEQSK